MGDVIRFILSLFNKGDDNALETDLPSGRFDDHQRLLSEYRAAGL